jgi:hypothetical protein
MALDNPGNTLPILSDWLVYYYTPPSFNPNPEPKICIQNSKP